VDAQRVEAQHQQHGAVLERLVAVEDALDDRRLGKVVVAGDPAGRVPAPGRHGVAGRLGRQRAAHVVHIPAVLRRVLRLPRDIEVDLAPA
jgi:hypothetical protein